MTSQAALSGAKNPIGEGFRVQRFLPGQSLTSSRNGTTPQFDRRIRVQQGTRVARTDSYSRQPYMFLDYRKWSSAIAGSGGECMKRWSSRIFLIALLLFFISSPLMAQKITGTISGVVSDPTGAVVPNAQITITNTETGLA